MENFDEFENNTGELNSEGASNSFKEKNEQNSAPEVNIQPESAQRDADLFQSADSFNSSYRMSGNSITQDEPIKPETTAYAWEKATEQQSTGQPGSAYYAANDAEQPDPQPQWNASTDAGHQNYSVPNAGNGEYHGYGAPQSNYRAPGSQPQFNSAASQNDNRQAPPTQPYNFGSSYKPPVQQQPAHGKKKGKGGLIAAIVAIVVVVAVALAFLITKLGSSKPAENPSNEIVTDANGEIEAAASSEAPVQYATASGTESLTATQIAEKCRASVVGVIVYQNGQNAGEGSGVVMGFDSTNTYTYIMTCAHVVNKSGVTYGVLALDGTSYNAELVGYDTRTDIGVLKVQGTNFTVAEFGDSTQLKIGETVYAIGNPGGSEYFGSMTKGIVSAIDRNVSGTYNITCIQHDAAINPGNSGGALINSSGQVVGINSSKIADTDYEGMGFAVPTATAKSIAESLIAYGYVPNRPKLGINYASVNDYQLYSMVVKIKGLPTGSLIITNISDDGALAGTDAQKGDMIIAVNGKNMDTADVLLDIIDKGQVGDSLTLTLCRVNSKTYQTSTFDVTIKLVEDKGSNNETTTEEPAYDFDNPDSSGSYGFGDYDFGDFFKRYFGF